MPIIDEYGSRQLHFGSGDISVWGGLLAMDEVVGVVTFKQQEPREIGSRSEQGPGHSLDPSETPVRMTFEKVESIDVIIRQLQEVRVMMVEKMAGVGISCTCNENECCPECDTDENSTKHYGSLLVVSGGYSSQKTKINTPLHHL